jgi:hypothetical protein
MGAMQMMIAVLMLLGLVFAGGLWLLIRRIAFTTGDLPVTAEWIDELSLERYRPMMRLLDGEDLKFLRSQPGFSPEMASKLRTQRCQTFRGYLRSLTKDFRRVCAALKLIMLHSEEDRPELAAALVRHQFLFGWGIVSAEFRLILYRWGICGVDAGSLMKIFDGMRLELRTLVPAAAGTRA